MATVVTLTIQDSDAGRIVTAAQNPNSWAAGPGGNLFPPPGATSAAIIKNWLVGVCQQAVLVREGGVGEATAIETLPVIT